MKRGYFFTIDAVLALILVIIFSAFMVFSQLGEENTKEFENYKRSVEDATIMGYYLGVDATYPEFGMSETPPVGADTYYCAYGFEYDYVPETSTIKGEVEKKTYCRGNA